MYTEFNNIAGVTYTAPTEAAPANQTFTTWTFKWEIAAGSAVIGTTPNFGIYTKTGGNGAAFWDDSTLTYAVPEPSSVALLFGGIGMLALIRRRA